MIAVSELSTAQLRVPVLQSSSWIFLSLRRLRDRQIQFDLGFWGHDCMISAERLLFNSSAVTPRSIVMGYVETVTGTVGDVKSFPVLSAGREWATAPKFVIVYAFMCVPGLRSMQCVLPILFPVLVRPSMVKSLFSPGQDGLL